MLRSATHASLGDLAERQRDVVARAQVLAAGINDMTIYRRVRSGRWQRALPGVYLLGSGPLTTEQRRIAAALYAGPECQLTGLTVLHWYGFDYAPSTDKIHALVPHQVRCRSSGLAVIQRTLSMDDNPRDAGLYRVTSPARAIVDACRALTELRPVRAIVAEGVQRSIVSPKDLDKEIRRAARSRTALVRKALTELFDGVRSSAEAELREILVRSRVLPRILWNPRLVAPDGTSLPTPDGWIDEGAIALEVDSREHHGDPDGWRRTLARHNRLSEHGVVVLHFTPAEIRTEPKRVLRLVEQTFESRRTIRSAIEVLRGAPS